MLHAAIDLNDMTYCLFVTSFPVQHSDFYQTTLPKLYSSRDLLHSVNALLYFCDSELA